MNLNLPGPITKVFGGVATGVVKAQDAAIAMDISTGYGEQPIFWAIEIPIGHNRADAAVLDMNCVRPHDRQNKTTMNTYGLGLSPIKPTTQSAIMAPAPVLSKALAKGNIPAKRKIVTQSMPK